MKTGTPGPARVKAGGATLTLMPPAYKSLGQNPTTVPEGNWVRVYVSPSGNMEKWVEHTLQLSYIIICD